MVGQAGIEPASSIVVYPYNMIEADAVAKVGSCRFS